MCGIFGIIANPSAGFSRQRMEPVVKDLFKLSESRGKEASGMAMLDTNRILVCKHSQPASQLIRGRSFREIFDRGFTDENGTAAIPVAVMGHSRLVTNGAQQIHANNQPVIKSDIVGIHNGIITNVDDLWRAHPDLDRRFDIDTEVFLALIRKYVSETGSLESAAGNVFDAIEGAASVALCFSDLDRILLATNCGSLYLASEPRNQYHLFASENYILQTLLRKRRIRKNLPPANIQQIRPGMGVIIGLKTFEADWFDLAENSDRRSSISPIYAMRAIEDVSIVEERTIRQQRFSGEGPYILPSHFADEFPRNRVAVDTLKRCTRCILPETMPFVDFDRQGVCAYCRNYKRLRVKGLRALEETIAPHRRNGKGPDCLVTFSGGRDSSYCVHVLKTQLGLNPVAYTYDWGMVTDLARRNQMRICGQLGIEHILVSADIARKRANIRANVSAWLKKPVLGLIPLFMAGDKQYFYHAHRIAKQTGCRIIILGENLLETTRFKSAFCGIPPLHETRHTYTISLTDKFRIAAYYGGHYLKNTGYLNSSVTDTIGAFCSYYVIPHNIINLYEYIKWDEPTINSTLIDGYNWETARDTRNTWRIGDGTAAFYNYIYYTMAGFTENDTFRSNQIREGMISRDQALAFARTDNEPRYESMQWYCDVIGIDFEAAIRAINHAPKLYLPV